MIDPPRAARRHCVVLVAILSLGLPLAALAQTAPVVVSVDVSGNAHVPTDRILSVVKMKPGMPFNEQTVREDVQSIFDLGYFADQVPPLIRQRPDGIAITYRVIENPVIQQIQFTGNDHVPSDTLLALMDTAVGQVLNSNTLHQDVLKINSYYDKIGYSGQVPNHVHGIKIDAQTGVLALDVREGLTVSAIEITGDPLIKKTILAQALTLKVGQPYSEEARDKDYENLKKVYEKYDLQLGDFEAGIDPTTVNLDNGTAAVKYSIYAMKVGAVQITGNTITKDRVVRRQLRMRPGDYVTQSGLRRDYERLNNLGFFEKVELNPKPGPNPKKPYEVTLDWNVKEQRTGTAQVGAGYSGGPTGQGLTGTLSYGQSNINGTGNGAQIRYERGSRVADASLSYTEPYLGDTPKAEKYSLAASIFTSKQTNYYQVYGSSAASALGTSPIICGIGIPCPPVSSNGGTVPVTLVPNSDTISGVAATYGQEATGASTNLGRRLSDYVTASVGVNVQRLSTDVSAPAPYFVPGAQTVFQAPLTTSPFGVGNESSTLGVIASSIAPTSNGDAYDLHSVSFGLADDTRDDVFNPRRGVNASLTEEISDKSLASDFTYTITTLDVARFFPVFKASTLGFHALAGDTTGAVPPSKLFVFSDQQLRGYSEVFYGTRPYCCRRNCASR